MSHSLGFTVGIASVRMLRSISEKQLVSARSSQGSQRQQTPQCRSTDNEFCSPERLMGRSLGKFGRSLFLTGSYVELPQAVTTVSGRFIYQMIALCMPERLTDDS